MSWLHGTAAGLSFACCLVALLPLQTAGSPKLDGVPYAWARSWFLPG